MNDNSIKNNDLVKESTPFTDSANPNQNQNSKGYDSHSINNVTNHESGVNVHKKQYLPNQKYDFSDLISLRKLAKTYLWFFLFIIIFFILGIILISFSYIFAIVLFSFAVVFSFINFLITIALAVKSSRLEDEYNSRFIATHTLFIIGIFFTIFALIAAFMTLSRIKKSILYYKFFTH